MTRRVTSLALAILVAAISAFGALLGMVYGFGLKCDESCDSPSQWRDNPDAWQWTALGSLGVCTFACALVLLVAVLLRRKRIAWSALVAWGVVGALFVYLFEAGLSASELGWVLLIGVGASGTEAIALMRSGKITKG
jgi:uncharacterized BrkB/YihY/UPF0761 family membrane protein